MLRIIPREDHPISRKHISPNALRVLYRLRDSGFQSFLVGGAVRDLLVGIQPKDFDIATDATPEQVRQLFRNCRLIGRRFRLAHVIYGPEIIEVATFRAADAEDHEDRSLESGRILRDNVWGSIEDDAVRRDFGANALYYNIEDFSVRDYVGGYEDIEKRQLRLIGDAETRYREDPVRMLRAVRLSSKLGFTLHPDTEAPIGKLSELMESASNARLFDETLKMFMAGQGAACFAQLDRLGLVSSLFPDLGKALEVDVSGRCRGMIDAALINTDRRVAEELPVTPAYLYAVLLWPVYADGVNAMLSAGHPMPVAEQRSADRAILRQCKRVAIPRRFTQAVEEIWMMQSRMNTRLRKKVLRLLAHPRFRAAFDFLELRSGVVPELVEEASFWREIQQGEPEAVLARHPADAERSSKPRRRRRRRPNDKADAPE